MKKTKLFYGNQHVKDIYLGKTKWEVFVYKTKLFFKKLLQLIGLALLVMVGLGIGRFFYPSTVTVEKEVIVEAARKFPVLDKIALCESSNRHFDKNGQVLVVGNTNKSVDIGRFQINNVIWGKKAKELGLDLMNEKDNEKFAVYLYENYGTEPWVWSKKCWINK